jgi:hypothetical protein
MFSSFFKPSGDKKIYRNKEVGAQKQKKRQLDQLSSTSG